MKTVMVVTTLLFFCSVVSSHAQSDDCCWGPGCPFTPTSISIHESETTTNRCLNTNEIYSPQMGYCEEYSRSPAYVNLACTISSCVFQGSLKCPTPYGFIYPGYTLNCPAQNGQLPVAGGGFNGAQCHFPDGTVTGVNCSDSGTASYWSQ